MKLEKIQIEFQKFNQLSELSSENQQLLSQAWKAVDNAYAPYSNFKVGAAVLLENGKVIIGNNQENAAYPSGLCAERVALFSASAQFPGIKIKAIAIVAKAEKFVLQGPLTPCGSCRQVIAEYQFIHKYPIEIIMDGGDGAIYKSIGIQNLLPWAFYNENLKKK